MLADVFSNTRFFAKSEITPADTPPSVHFISRVLFFLSSMDHHDRNYMIVLIRICGAKEDCQLVQYPRSMQ